MENYCLMCVYYKTVFDKRDQFTIVQDPSGGEYYCSTIPTGHKPSTLNVLFACVPRANTPLNTVPSIGVARYLLAFVLSSTPHYFDRPGVAHHHLTSIDYRTVGHRHDWYILFSSCYVVKVQYSISGGCILYSMYSSINGLKCLCNMYHNKKRIAYVLY
jgi:hypothetical protein